MMRLEKVSSCGFVSDAGKAFEDGKRSEGSIDVETLVGSTLGGYTLTRIIGSGGMGTVYLAEDEAIGQQVAIKVVRTDDSPYADGMSSGEVAERFRREARAVASLDHLNILPLYRYGEEQTAAGSRSYMVMQYRPEGSLWAWLRRRTGLVESSRSGGESAPEAGLSGLPTGWPLQAKEVADYVQQAASALQYAHDRGFIHRDVKPENFLLRFDKNPTDNSHKAFLLLSDFGLAKFFSNLSSNSQILGTPTYMAPEQFTGNACPESDQYALAVMAFCLLTGQPPFNGDPIYLMNQHLSAPPPAIRIFIPGLPASIETVLDRALAKTPSERYPSISEFADAFAQAVSQEPGTTRMDPASRPHLTLPTYTQPQLQFSSPESAFASTPAYRPPTPQPAPQTQLVPQTQLQLPSLASQPGSAPSQSPFVPSAPTTLAQGQATVSDNDQGQRSSQEGGVQERQSGVQGQQTISRRSATKWIIGGAAAIATVALGAGAAGLYLNKQTSSAQSTLPGVGSPIKQILRGHQQSVTSVAWSPTGIQLASGSLDRSVRLWRLDQPGNSSIIQEHKMGVQALAWEPAGTFIASGSGDSSIYISNATDGTLSQTFSAKGARSVGISRIAWSADGTNIFVSTLGNGLQKIQLAAHKVTAVRGRTIVRAMALSPDGQYLAFGSENGVIMLLKLPALTLTPLSDAPIHKGSIHALAWSPDSTLLASGGIDTTVSIFDVAGQHLVSTLAHNSAINDIAWQPGDAQASQTSQTVPSGGRIAVAQADSTLSIWMLRTNTYTSYKGHIGPVTSVAWGRQGLATGSFDKTIIIWNVL